MDKLIEQALKENKIVRYIPTFVKVLETYKSLLEAENEALHKPVVVRPASAVERGGELLATEALDTLAEAGEETRKDFCIWYYAQSQPLDANKIFAWFLARKSSEAQA